MRTNSKSLICTTLALTPKGSGGHSSQTQMKSMESTSNLDLIITLETSSTQTMEKMINNSNMRDNMTTKGKIKNKLRALYLTS